MRLETLAESEACTVTANGPKDGAFASFHRHYDHLLIQSLLQLDVLIESLPEEYAEGYKLWRDIISCLRDGVQQLIRQEPPSSHAAFSDALHTFCLEGAVHLLFDLVGHEKDNFEEAAHFRMHVMRLQEIYLALSVPQPSI